MLPGPPVGLASSVHQIANPRCFSMLCIHQECGELVVIEPDQHFSLVDDVVMETAEHDGIFQRRRTTILPVNDVVYFAIDMRHIASRIGASAVAQNHGTSNAGRKRSLCSSDIERLAFGIQHGWDN